MTSVFKKIGIVCTQNTDQALHLLEDLITKLQDKKIEIILDKNSIKKCDLIIVMGGDGSILSSGKISAVHNLPIVGINFGRLGFLSDIAADDIFAIDKILSGEFFEETRFLLSISFISEHQKPNNSLAINDVVFLCESSGQIIDFSVSVDNQFLCNYRADGLIISTPTGSTAHSLSGGGPILHPMLDVLTLVPMLSHNLNSRPIVISSNSHLEITFHDCDKADIMMRCDGQINTIQKNTTVKIKKANEKLRLLHPNDYNYFETLRSKLHWQNA